jgi:hypothetical protein
MSRIPVIHALRLACLLALAFAFFFVSQPSAAADSGNQVNVSFRTDYLYHPAGDSFANGEVTGRKEWHTDVNNTPDASAGAIASTTLRFATGDVIDHFSEDGLVSEGPSTYEWFYGELPEGGHANAYANSSEIMG